MVLREAIKFGTSTTVTGKSVLYKRALDLGVIGSNIGHHWRARCWQECTERISQTDSLGVCFLCMPFAKI